MSTSSWQGNACPVRRAGAWILFALACLATNVAAPAAAPRAARPNIVVILADDAGWGDYSLHGNRNLATPHLDSLARDGASFDRFFVCAVCAPTRAEFLTGRYHPRSGVQGVSTGQERMNVDERTVADVLRASGYATGCFGKWHNGSQWPYHPRARGFDEYYGFTSGHWGEYFDPPLERDGRMVRGRGYVADDLTTQALDFIERRREQPFFCYLAFNTPHSPWAAPAEDWERFRDKPIESRGTDAEREDLDTTRCVLAMMENLDRNVGRVLGRLAELGLADDTIVVYFSDNGPNTHRFNGGMKGKKATLDEGGLRSPLHVRWPRRIPAGTHVRQVAAAIDLAPTLVQLAGVRWDGAKPLDGRDLSPLVLARDAAAPPPAWPDREILASFGPNVSVRTQRFRLDARGALFDLEHDPGQAKDCAADHPEVARRLRDVAARHRAEVVGARPTTDEPSTRSKGKGNWRLPADDRPFPAGYREFPWTPLPARDGVPHGGVRRSAPAPNCSYFVDWRSLDDRITWDVEVQAAGEYEATLYYQCDEADAGSTIELAFGDAKLSATVAPGFAAPLFTNQDTLPRPPAESKMKEFRPLVLGTFRLEAGRRPLTLRATKIAGKHVADVRMITLTLKP